MQILGQPSAALADKLEKEEKDRVAATVEQYGPEGLAKLAKEIEDAQAENDKPIPSELISKFKVPDVKGIEWIKVESARSHGVARGEDAPNSKVQKHIDADGSELPLFVQYDREYLVARRLMLANSHRPSDINSNFIQVSIVLFATDIPGFSPAQLRALLPIYLDSFFTLPVTRADGTKLDYEDVVRSLDAETLSYSIEINTPLQEGITLKMKVAKDKYPVAVAWLSDLLHNSTFSVDR